MSKKEEKKSKKELTKKELRRARRFHRSRPARARKLDEARLSKRVTYDVEKWMRAPDRYDLPGVDTPDAAEWRRRLAEAMRVKMSEAKKAPIKKCEIVRSKGRYAVVCWHDLGGVLRPVMHGAYKSLESAREKLTQLTARAVGGSIEEALRVARELGVRVGEVLRGRTWSKDIRDTAFSEGVATIHLLRGRPREEEREVLRRVAVWSRSLESWVVSPWKLRKLSDEELEELASELARIYANVEIGAMPLAGDLGSSVVELLGKLDGLKLDDKCRIRFKEDDYVVSIECTGVKKFREALAKKNLYALKILKAFTEGVLEGFYGGRGRG